MVKPGYKQTEIGVIPEDWECCNIEQYGQIYGGGTPSTNIPKYWDGAIAWCTPSDITKTAGKYISKTDRTITIDGLNNSAATLMPNNSILLCTRATIGELKLCSIPMTTNQGFKNIILNGENSPDFLYYLLQIKKDDMYALAIGSTFLELSKTNLCKIALQRPPFPEQQKIATALSDIDALITNLEKLIAKKKAIKQGAMQELLTGKRRLPGFGGVWETVRLGDHCAVLRGGSPRPIQAYLTSSPQGANWIKIGDVREGDKYITATAERIIEAGISKSREVFVGDFILSNSMSFGRPYILKINGCIHDGWLVIQNYQDSFDQQYLYYVLGSDMVKSQYISMAAGSSVQNLNKEKVGNVMLHKPDIEEQHSIAAILSDMDEEISKYEHQLRKYKGVKQGMMSELLTGRIRLV